MWPRWAIELLDDCREEYKHRCWLNNEYGKLVRAAHDAGDPIPRPPDELTADVARVAIVAIGTSGETVLAHNRHMRALLLAPIDDDMINALRAREQVRNKLIVYAFDRMRQAGLKLLAINLWSAPVVAAWESDAWLEPPQEPVV